MRNALRFASILLLFIWQAPAIAQTYCAAGPSSTFDSEITNVALVGDNFSISNLLTCPGAAGVQNFTGTDSADVSQGTSYSLFVTFGTCGGVYSSAGQAWIDFNDDGDFTDAGESLGTWTGSPESQNSTTFNATFNFTVPTGATLGESRMRIMHWEGGSLPLNSCGTYIWGAVEDYKIVITNTPPPCPIPGSLSSTPAATAATINWSSTGTAFDIEYGPIGFTQGTGTTTTSTTTSVTLSNLTPNTGYDVYVRNNCTAAGNGTSSWSFAHTFYTSCTSIDTYPWIENFEGSSWLAASGFSTSPDAIDQCWDRNPASYPPMAWLCHTANTGSSNTGPGAAYSGNNYMYTEQSSGTVGAFAYLELPAFNMDSLTNPLFSYYYHRYGATMGDMAIQVSTDTGTTWTTVFTKTGQQQSANSDPWAEELVDLTLFKSSHTLVRFRATKGTSFTSDMAIDDVKLEEAPPCPKPTAVSAGNLTSSSADITWLSSGVSFVVEYGPVGFTQGTGMLDTVSSSPATLTGLTANSEYDAYVLNDCSGAGNGISAWAGPVTFRTLCSPFAEGYFQNFDALTGGTKDPCWFDLSLGGTSPHTVEARVPFTFSNVQPFSTPNLLYWYNAGAQQSLVITPELAGLDGDTSQVRFRMTHNYFNAATVMNVWIGTMSDRSDTSTIAWHDTITLAQYTWNEYSIQLTNVPTGHRFVVFGRGNSPTFAEVDMDDFYYEGIPACAPPQSGTAIAGGPNSGIISWSGLGSTFNIEYGPSGFTQGTGPVKMNVTSPDTLTNLISNTCYDVYIQQDCGSGSTSPWYGPITFCTPCVAQTMPFTEDFSTWPPNCFQLFGSANWNWDQNAAGHAQARFWNFSSGQATMATPPIAITSKAQVQFKWAHLYSAFYPDDQMVVRAQVVGSSQWDTLANFIGPTFNNTNSGNTTPPTSTADFTQELFYLDSATFVGNNAIIEFIAITDFGPNLYVDDVVVEAVPACPPPTALAATSIQGFQADINWSSISGSQFVIEYGPQGFGQGSGVMDTVTSSPHTIAGLTPVTCYDVYIMTLCGANGNSTWAGPLNFCTLVSCPVPTNVNPGAVTTNSATISWTTGSSSDWNYVIGPTGTTPGSGTVMSTTSNPLTISSLTPATGYSFWLRDSCGPGDVSNWVGPINFNTLCNTFSLNYTESFSGWVGTAPPCWDVEEGSQNTSSFNQGGNVMAHMRFWTFNSPNDFKLTSPAVAITQKSRLKFKWSSNGSTFYQDTVVIRSKPTTQSTWDTVAVWIAPDCQCSAGNTTPGTLVDSILTLDTNYVGSDIQVQFWGISDWGPDFFVDDVMIEVDPQFASCPAPQSLTVSNVTSTSADLGWTSTGTNFQVSYGAGTFPASQGTIVTTTSNPYSVMNLASSTTHNFYVRQICQAGDTSVWSGPFSFTTACGTFSSPFTEAFNGTGLPNCWSTSNPGGNTSANAIWKNTSTNWPFYGAQGITDHTGVGTSYAMGVDGSSPTLNKVQLETPFIDVSNLNNPELTFWLFSNNTTNPGDNNDFYIDLYDGSAWQDSIFHYAGDSASWKEFIVPLGSYTITGDIKIRFNIDKTANPAFYNDIILDDVSIDGSGGCAAPTNFASTSIGCDSVEVDWNSDPATVQSEIIYGPVGFNPQTGGTSVSPATAPFTITGLSPGTGYDVYVIDSCAAGTSAPQSITVTTPSAPMPTISFSVNQINTTGTSADVEFDASASSNYTSLTWDFGGGNTSNNVVATNTYTMNSTYSVTLTLTNGCGQMDTTFDVTVTGIGIDESELARTLNIFPNPSSGAFAVDFNLNASEDVTIKVLDPIGRLVAEKELGLVSGAQHVTFDLDNQASGVYLIQIVTDSGTLTKRITIRNR